ncbi:hypothetical protein NDU88_005823 [Pleurodeles waltl]|uniref:Uncharacterized protein n=1 Tax=Pleurodeles waltl TaxID=8319 RepID=A0AAV7PJ86_PLEWA|nr:hypothetical protein NDU88_005823 [Pleurodeles waltl]
MRITPRPLWYYFPFQLDATCHSSSHQQKIMQSRTTSSSVPPPPGMCGDFAMAIAICGEMVMWYTFVKLGLDVKRRDSIEEVSALKMSEVEGRKEDL